MSIDGYDAWRTSPPPEQFWPEAEFTRAAEVDLEDLWIDADCTFTADGAGLVSLVDARFAGRSHSAAQLEALIGADCVAAIEAGAADWWAEEGAQEWLGSREADEGDYRYEMRRDEDA